MPDQAIIKNSRDQTKLNFLFIVENLYFKLIKSNSTHSVFKFLIFNQAFQNSKR